MKLESLELLKIMENYRFSYHFFLSLAFEPVAFAHGYAHGYGGPGSDRSVIYLLSVWDISGADPPPEVSTSRTFILNLVDPITYELSGSSLIVQSQHKIFQGMRQIWQIDVSDPLHPGEAKRIDGGMVSISTVHVEEGRVYAVGRRDFIGVEDQFLLFLIP